MGQNIVKITSNDSAYLKKIYNKLKDERLNVTSEEKPNGNMGVDFVVNLNISIPEIIALITFIKYCLIDKQCTLFKKNSSGESEAVNVELLEKPEEVIDLIKEEGSELYIEHKGK